MTDYERSLSNLSYTNKDFGQIYPELLDLVKKISYKWDPSESDESDPGVVLLKLAALMADKNNYNIDKNILELFPLSVTQETNARQIFDQCGYSMKHYQSATGSVEFTMIKEPSVADSDLDTLGIAKEDVKEGALVYKIPKFTMLSDVDNNIIYTTTADALLKSDRVSVTVPIIQGIITDYTINGESTITSANLDYNNRLYLTGTMIAENGIFISTVGYEDYKDWKKVDNLLLEAPQTKCYKFGISSDGYSCYIEFPDDIETLIGNGLNIKYVMSRGFEGNIGKRVLCQFYNDVSATRYRTLSHEQTVSLTTENIHIVNFVSVNNGKNPETIDEAYRSYSKIKNTFKTLVSTKDYENFFYTNENVSNGFVCDRSDDIQSSYRVVENGEVTKSHCYVREDETNTPEMTPFDIRVYALTYVDNPNTVESFQKSFNVIVQRNDTVTEWERILRDSEDIKTIAHNYKQFELDRILMLKNKYPICCKVIPQYELSPIEQTELIETVTKALYTALNSRKLDFGETVSYETVYDTISGADARIKAIMLEDMKYETYAVYCTRDDGSGKLVIKELRIDSDSVEPTEENSKKLWHDFRNDVFVRSVLGGTTPLLTADNPFTYSINQTDIKLFENINYITTETTLCADKVDNVAAGLDNSGYQYIMPQLSEHENIVLTCPNLLKDEEYSSYVKFIHNIGCSDGNRPLYSDPDVTVIRSNGEYTLQQGEYIVFFWKPEETSPYHYYKYSSSSTVNTISPTFSLNKQPHPESGPKIPNEFFLNSLPDGAGTVEMRSFYDEDGKPYPLNDFISGLAGKRFVLSGSNAIVTKKHNTVHINNLENGTHEIFWLLNKSRRKIEISTGNLVEKSVLFKENETTYMLENDEYVIYSNPTRTEMIILGSGTLLTRSGNSLQEWSCLYDPEYEVQFVEKGIEFLTDHGLWFTIPSVVKLYATEMQYRQLGAGSTLLLEAPASDAQSEVRSIVFKNDGTYVLKIGSSELSPLTNLSDYTVSYISSDGTNNTLVTRNNKEDAWIGYSVLNLDTSTSTAQFIKEHQTVVVKGVENNELGRVSNQYILTDQTLSLIGGSDIDVKVVDLKTEEDILLNMYAYSSTYDSANNRSVVNPSEFGGVVTLESSNQTSEDTSFNYGNLLVEQKQDEQSNLINYLKYPESWELTGSVSFPTNYPYSSIDEHTYLNTTKQARIYGATYTFSCVITNKTQDVTVPLAIDLEGHIVGDPFGNPEFLSYTGTDPKKIEEFYNASVFELQPGESKKFECTYVLRNQTLDGTLTTTTDVPFNIVVGKDFKGTDVSIEVSNIEILQAPHIRFTALPGKYLLPITVIRDCEELDFHLFKHQDTTVEEVGSLPLLLDRSNTSGDGSQSYNKSGTYYLVVNVEDDELENNGTPITCDIFVRYSLTIKEDIYISSSVTYDKLFRYEPPENTDIYVEKISQLDPDGYFNPTHMIPENALIEDPLASISFLDPLHVFNPYVICEWDVTNKEKNKLSIFNKVR